MPRWSLAAFFGGLFSFKSIQATFASLAKERGPDPLLDDIKLCSFNMIVKYPKENREKILQLLVENYDFDKENDLVKKYKKNKVLLKETSFFQENNHCWKLTFKNKVSLDSFLNENESSINDFSVYRCNKIKLDTNKEIAFGFGHFNLKGYHLNFKYWSQFETAS